MRLGSAGGFLCTKKRTSEEVLSSCKQYKPELLQKMLGHADYSTAANIYEHFDIDQLIDAID